MRISPAARRGATGFIAFDTIVWGKLKVSLMSKALNAAASHHTEPVHFRAPAPIFCRDVELRDNPLAELFRAAIPP
jgi:hypothetical protein